MLELLRRTSHRFHNASRSFGPRIPRDSSIKTEIGRKTIHDQDSIVCVFLFLFFLVSSSTRIRSHVDWSLYWHQEQWHLIHTHQLRCDQFTCSGWLDGSRKRTNFSTFVDASSPLRVSLVVFLWSAGHISVHELGNAPTSNAVHFKRAHPLVNSRFPFPSDVKDGRFLYVYLHAPPAVCYRVHKCQKVENGRICVIFQIYLLWR